MPFRKVPLSTGVLTTPFLAIHRLLVANSAMLPSPSSMMALSKPRLAASRMARWPFGYRQDALASVGAMLDQERAKLEKQAEALFAGHRHLEHMQHELGAVGVGQQEAVGAVEHRLDVQLGAFGELGDGLQAQVLIASQPSCGFISIFSAERTTRWQCRSRSGVRPRNARAPSNTMLAIQKAWSAGPSSLGLSVVH